jgi:uncharacterized protein (TIGR02466 family)
MNLIESRPFFSSLFSFWLPTDVSSSMVDHVRYLQKNDSGVNKSNVGGWHSSTFEEVDSKITGELFDMITPAVSEIYKRMAISKTPSLSNYWYNVNGVGDYNLQHIHPGSFISGCVYFKVPKDSGTIRIYRPDNLRLVLEHELSENNEYNYPFWEYTPSDNFCVLFPSWMEHAVMQNKTKEECADRISLAFNYR